ncbi:MAG: helix-turn-helix transcriptional regulator [Clostridia bacterium]|nr:helix-turn-helix transcriptional regulator [Clostridia bacterium]
MRVELRQIQIGSFQSSRNDGQCHIKALPYFSVVQATEGYYTIRLGEGVEHCAPREAVFLAPAQVKQTITHYTDPDSGVMSARWVFMEVYVDGYPLDYLYSFPVTASAPDGLLDALFGSADPCDRMSNGYLLVKWLLAQGTKKEPSAEAISAVLQLMRREYARPLTVAELAEAAHLSESHFYAVFKEAMGCPPLTYLNDYRLSIASALLKETEHPIGQIAEQVGIPDRFYFNRLFKRRYHKTPTEYKKSP